MNPLLATALESLPHDACVLDCGGWFIPLPAATHIVDLMPYETRGGKLQLEPLSGENFTKATWHQVDFLSPDLRLPFPDKFFALCNCSHTLEDLADPFPLMKELRRVASAGYFASPSRLVEQTAGIRDRMTNRRGHPHHRWIIEAVGNRPVLAHKADSLDGAWWRTSVPLRRTEHMCSVHPEAVEWQYLWEGGFEWDILRGTAARYRAMEFARDAGSTFRELMADLMFRHLRRLKYIRRPATEARISSWWKDMVQLSQPYSRIMLQ